MKGYLFRLALLSLLLISAASGAADYDEVRRLRMQGAIVPLEQIFRQLPEAEKTRIIDVEFAHEHEHGGYIYEIECLQPGGVVREYVFDAVSGRFLGIEPEDRD